MSGLNDYSDIFFSHALLRFFFYIEYRQSVSTHVRVFFLSAFLNVLTLALEKFNPSIPSPQIASIRVQL